MPIPDIDAQTYKRVEERIGRVHLKQRLGIETDNEGKVFGQGRNFFHIENWVSASLLIGATLKLALLYSRGKRNARAIKLRFNDIGLRGLPAAFDGYTLLQISDPHLDMAADVTQTLIDTIQALDYDACVLTGDYRASTSGPYNATITAMQRLRPYLKTEVYAVLGNHDSILMVPAMEEMGIRLLLNECLSLERDGAVIYLAGVDDPHYYRADNLEKAADPIPHDAISILLSHSPEIYKQAAHAGFDIMLSGHTHGGQICLPGGIPLMVNAHCPRRYCKGEWAYHRLQGYTSVGSGSCVVDVRLNCPPEVTLHRLHCA